MINDEWLRRRQSQADEESSRPGEDAGVARSRWLRSLDDVDRIVLCISQAAILLSSAGQVSSWNASGESRFPQLVAGASIGDVASAELARAVLTALASSDDEVPLAGHGARLIRLSKERRLLLFDTVETEGLLPAGGENYRTLIDNSPVLFWTAGSAGAVFISQRSEQVTGYSREEVLSDAFPATWAASVHPEDLPRVVAAYESLFRDGTPFEVEYRFRRKDGRWAWLWDHAVHTYVRDGRLLAEGVSMDITERKRAENQQLALAAFVRRALTSTDDVALMNDACRTVVDVLEVPATAVLMFLQEENAFSLPAVVGADPPAGYRIPNDPQRLPAVVMRSDAPLVYSDLATETRFAADELIAWKTVAGIAAPMFGRAARFGVLHARTNEPRAFSQREAAFVQSVAGILAEAIERNRAERELERQKAQLSDAQAFAHVGSLVMDFETGRMQWSDELYRIFGLEPQSQVMTFEWAVNRLAPENREYVKDVRKRFEAGEVVEDDVVIVRADDVRRLVHYRALPVTDQQTGRVTVIGTVHDITAARQAAATLRDHERRLRVIVDRLPVMIFSTDAELRLTSVTGEGFASSTSTALADLGMKLTDVIGMPPAWGGPHVVLSGREATYETRRGDRDLRVHIEPLTDENGATIGTVGIAFDVTEEKRAERDNAELMERLHDAAREWLDTFDSVQAPLVILDAHRRVRRMNASALQLSSFEDSAKTIGQPVDKMGDARIWRDIDALARGARLQRQTIALQHTDDERRAWDLLASVVHDQTVIIMSDVTELVHMQENLRRAEQMSKMGALVAGVAHEVRNPLFGISATLDAFENRFGAEQFREYVGALREQVDRMSQLMQELLEYGRPLGAELHTRNPGPVLRRAVESMRTFAKQNGVGLRPRISTTLPDVRMDWQRLLQVFENLIKNAIEHSPKGGEISVTATSSDDRVTIRVEDSGPGFAAEDLPRIFEPFFTRRRGGTGLGLSLARKIVDEHQGSIEASNRASGGASMVVTLPASDEVRTS